MIPLIEDVIDALMADEITKEEALRWINYHVKAAHARGREEVQSQLH